MTFLITGYLCHSRAGGNPGFKFFWIPAFAGMTVKEKVRKEV